MKRTIAILLILISVTSLFASFNTLSMQYEYFLEDWYFGEGNKYRTEEEANLVGASLTHYHIKDEKNHGWNARVTVYSPIGGYHEIFDTKNNDYTVESSDLKIHTLPLGMELAAGPTFHMRNFYLSIDPTVCVDTWNYGFPTFLINVGLDIEGAAKIELTDRICMLAGARVEYDFARYMLGWVAGDRSNGWLDDYERFGLIPFIGVSIK